jgi:hypothetical protein
MKICGVKIGFIAETGKKWGIISGQSNNVVKLVKILFFVF